MIEMTADWQLNKTLPQNLHDLSSNPSFSFYLPVSGQQQRYLHSFSWSHPGWSSIPCHRLISSSRDLFSSDNHSSLERIISGVLSSQTELVPMWFEEILVSMRSSSFSPFPWNNPREDVLLAAVFVALAEEDPLCQIWILG